MSLFCPFMMKHLKILILIFKFTNLFTFLHYLGLIYDYKIIFSSTIIIPKYFLFHYFSCLAIS